MIAKIGEALFPIEPKGIGLSNDEAIFKGQFGLQVRGIFFIVSHVIQHYLVPIGVDCPEQAPDLVDVVSFGVIDNAHLKKIIILSMHHTNEHIFRAIQAGARAYLLKESAGAGVAKAVQAVMKGEHYYGAGVEAPPKAAPTSRRTRPSSPLESLSQREREVLQLVVEGKTSVEIAEILSLSPKSIETYRSRLMLKLAVNNIPALVKFALLHGMTPADNN